MSRSNTKNEKNNKYIPLLADYVIHEDSDSCLLIVGKSCVGKSFLVSKFVGVKEDLTQKKIQHGTMEPEIVF